MAKCLETLIVVFVLITLARLIPRLRIFVCLFCATEIYGAVFSCPNSVPYILCSSLCPYIGGLGKEVLWFSEARTSDYWVIILKQAKATSFLILFNYLSTDICLHITHRGIKDAQLYHVLDVPC